MILNLYIPNSRALKYIKQKLKKPKRQIDTATIIGGDFNVTDFASN